MSREQIAQSVFRFVDRHISPNLEQWEQQGRLPRELYQLAGEAGLLGLGYPEELGGTPATVDETLALTRELMRTGCGGLVAGLLSHSIALPPLVAGGSEELKRELVPPVLQGNRIAALAVTEPGGGSDVAAITTRAELCSDHYVVTGAKTFITSGCQADLFTLAVRTGGEGAGGVSLLMVEADTPGLSRSSPLKKMGWHASDTAEIYLDHIRVPANRLVGEEGQGFALLMANFVRERLNLAVMANTTSELALEKAAAYASIRNTFGSPLIDKAVIRHKLAEMATRLEASICLTEKAARKMDAGDNCAMESAMAKNMATDSCDFITHQGVQILGGLGYMREAGMERLARDGRLLSIGGGTREIMNEIIAKCLLEQ
ncbi:acyl-CoA dehydrogenase family protein [Ferrimonas futtsuensis]|uniref:acyl-CoA dehydrogenase family protein n=1 Tax=Ferrimonas futtsuensis TaxID=364764 RepID=UPI00040F1E27|nr:acyl-CoA dehydrogenase family protein [Ferrimonas futtsuensis]